MRLMAFKSSYFVFYTARENPPLGKFFCRTSYAWIGVRLGSE